MQPDGAVRVSADQHAAAVARVVRCQRRDIPAACVKITRSFQTVQSLAMEQGPACRPAEVAQGERALMACACSVSGKTCLRAIQPARRLP